MPTINLSQFMFNTPGTLLGGALITDYILSAPVPGLAWTSVTCNDPLYTPWFPLYVRSARDHNGIPGSTCGVSGTDVCTDTHSVFGTGNDGVYALAEETFVATSSNEPGALMSRQLFRPVVVGSLVTSLQGIKWYPLTVTTGGSIYTSSYRTAIVPSGVSRVMDDDPDAPGAVFAPITQNLTLPPLSSDGSGLSEQWYYDRQSAGRRVAFKVDWPTVDANFKLFGFDIAGSDAQTAQQ